MPTIDRQTVTAAREDIGIFAEMLVGRTPRPARYRDYRPRGQATARPPASLRCYPHETSELVVSPNGTEPDPRATQGAPVVTARRGRVPISLATPSAQSAEGALG